MLSLHAQRLGAKFGQYSGRSADDFHPLICHMLDVAAVAEVMWDEVLTRFTRETLQGALGIVDATQARAWVAFLAGLHDLGKACPAFQRKYDEQFVESRLAGLPVSGWIAKDPGHGSVTGEVLGRVLVSEFDVPRQTGLRLAEVLAGHHGFFPEDLENATGSNIGEGDAQARDAWELLRLELTQVLAGLTGATAGAVTSRSLSTAQAMVLAGFVSVSDWIGSIDTIFEYQSAAASDLRTYQRRSRELALVALKELGWLDSPRPEGPRTFGELFDGRAPRALQKLIDDIVAPRNPQLVVIEAPTGEGKTEAALQLLHHWSAADTRGAYFALPTQATANQIHTRVERFLSKTFPGQKVNLQLVHGGTRLDQRSVAPVEVASDDGTEEGSVAAAEWFLPRKRSLLAPWGVGTIDQSLLSVLQVKHVFVRLFGLAGKPVVFDEVHAYDTYMTGLLERLLEWLGALGTPAVLLSATLPSNRRRLLFDAYARGLGREESFAETHEVEVYPRVTWLDAAGVQSRSFDATAPQILQLEWIDDPLPHLADVLRERLTGGGCAVVVCNTVNRAQEAYLALRDVFPGEVGLFHSRFLARDRERIEEKCLDAFGPPGMAGERPSRFVLVATQVVEQSLDIDFDVMVTDFAPIDLLLQRSGRLQRHDRGARRWPRQLVIRQVAMHESPPEFDPGTAAVYDEHILLRTWHQLRNRASISIPDEVQDLVDAVYAEDMAAPAGIDDAMAGRWEETQAGLREKQAAEREQAVSRRLSKPRASRTLSSVLKWRFEEDSPELHPALQALTRLAEPSVDVVLLPATSPLIPDEGKQPDRMRVDELLANALSVSHRALVRELRASAPPGAWRKVPALRHHRLIVLEAEGSARIGSFRLKYHPELGLLMEAHGAS